MVDAECGITYFCHLTWHVKFVNLRPIFHRCWLLDGLLDTPIGFMMIVLHSMIFCMHLAIRNWVMILNLFSFYLFLPFKHGYKFDFPRSCMNAREDVPWAGFSFSCWPRRCWKVCVEIRWHQMMTGCHSFLRFFRRQRWTSPPKNWRRLLSSRRPPSFLP